MIWNRSVLCNMIQMCYMSYMYNIVSYLLYHDYIILFCKMIRYNNIQRCILLYYTRSWYKNIIQDHYKISYDTILYDTGSYDTILNDMTQYQLIEYHTIRYRMNQYHIIFYNERISFYMIKYIAWLNIIGIVWYIMYQESHLPNTFEWRTTWLS